MEAITELGGKKASSVDELLSIMREMKKRLSTYEERVKPLPDAKTTWISSTIIGLMDRESLAYVRKAGASEDFDKMIAPIEELKLINKSIKKPGSLREEAESDSAEGDEDDEEDTEKFEKWARGPTTSKGELLAAIGNGRRKRQGPKANRPAAKKRHASRSKG